MHVVCNSPLNNPRGYDIIFLFNATVAQLVEHLIRNERVVGSNPISSSIFKGEQRKKFMNV